MIQVLSGLAGIAAGAAAGAVIYALAGVVPRPKLAQWMVVPTIAEVA